MLDRNRKVVLLDRDGVINHDSDQYIKSPAEWRPIDGSLEAIAKLSRAGYWVFVVSNQSGVGRGLLSEQELAEINERMLAAIAVYGGHLKGVYYCPHAPHDACDCRKPAPGLLRRIEREHSVSLIDQPLVGDKWSDLLAARAVGARPILVLTGRGASVWRHHAGEIEESYVDLSAAADALLAPQPR